MKLKKRYLIWIVFAAVVAAAITIDQATKFGLEGMEKSLIGNFLWITSVHNEGAAFSMFEGARWVFVGIGIASFLAILYVIFFDKKIKQSYLSSVALGMIAGGIIGNVVDRIAYGAVRDFIDFRFSGFAIFNFADSFLCVGCGLLILWVIISSVRDYKAKKNKEKTEQEKTEENK